MELIDHLFAEHWVEGGHPFLAELMKAAREGHLCVRPEEDPQLPPDLVYVGEETYPDQPIVRFGEGYYLQRHWAAETEVLNALKGLIQEEPRLPLTLQPEGVTDEQAKAIHYIADHSLTLLTGGPGTGKTYTAAQLIRSVLRVDPHHRILLAAPTGKAVGNLERSLRKLLGDETPDVKTLHALLKRRGERLKGDLILVDEASMIDVGMMARLLVAIPSGARLVLMGDSDQLPPVEAGGLFADMVSSLEVARLTRCLRVESGDLVQLAQEVKEGSIDRWPRLHPLSREGLIHSLAPRFPSPFASEIHLDEFMKFRLLAPIRKGPFGVEGLNRLFHSHFQELRPSGSAMATPIMITKNDYPLSLYNGEVGVLVEVDAIQDYALFPSRSDPLPRYALPPYEIAYCLSVHKSQGSEFDEVAFVLSPGSESFGRELFYTALTRAKRSFDLFGSREMLAQIVAKKTERLSQLSLRLGLD